MRYQKVLEENNLEATQIDIIAKQLKSIQHTLTEIKAKKAH